MSWKKAFAVWKLRFDIAVSFLVFVNFLLLSITASVPIQAFLVATGIGVHGYVVIIALIVCILIGTFFVGYLMDKQLQYWENLMTAQNQRNPMMLEILERIKKIEATNEEINKGTKI